MTSLETFMFRKLTRECRKQFYTPKSQREHFLREQCQEKKAGSLDVDVHWIFLGSVLRDCPVGQMS